MGMTESDWHDIEAVVNQRHSILTRAWHVIIVIGLIGALVWGLMNYVHHAATAQHCHRSLSSLGAALDNYHREYGAFPPAYTVDADGNPLHSWRTLLLLSGSTPEYVTNVLSIDLSRPWDHPANAAAVEGPTPTLYQCPLSDVRPGHTTYLGIVGPDAFFRPGESTSLSEITDDPAKTLTVIEVPLERSVHWMSPFDVDGQFLVSLDDTTTFAHTEEMLALSANGDPRPVNVKNLLPDERRAMTTIAGGEGVTDGQ